MDSYELGCHLFEEIAKNDLNPVATDSHQI